MRVLGLDLPNKLSLTVLVNNVWDQSTYSYVSTGSNGDADDFNDPRYHDLRSIDRPRTVWFTVRKGF